MTVLDLFWILWFLGLEASTVHFIVRNREMKYTWVSYVRLIIEGLFSWMAFIPRAIADTKFVSKEEFDKIQTTETASEIKAVVTKPIVKATRKRAPRKRRANATNKS